MERKTPTYMEFRNTDPIAMLIRDKLNWSPRRYCFVILAINLVIDLSLALYFRRFITSSGPPGLFQDPTTLLVDFVMMPVIGAYYIWSTARIGPLLQDLYESKVIPQDARTEKIVQEFKQTLQSKNALAASILCSVFITVIMIGTFLSWYPWPSIRGFYSHANIMIWLKSGMWLLTMYGLSFGLFNIATTVYFLRRIFRGHSINISPWHPDRCGGLKGISNYSMTLGYAIAVIGLTLSVQAIQEIRSGTFGSSYLTWLVLAMYILLSPMIFFLPLGTAHDAMRRAKKTHLLAISKQFDNHYKRITDTLSNDNGEIASRVKRIEALQTLYKITDDFTIWPFDVDNLRRFMTITLAPLLPALVVIGFEIIKILFLT
ncbi:MAG: hypothetical protein GTO18_00675 [Anaerolineales bacterium]|nr:hypothetical protein [Anaerolineales bacterium]